MLGNYINIAFRKLRKDWLYSLISITGLAIGIAVSVIIIQFVFHEWSFDKFHKNEESIFRLLSRNQEVTYPGFSSKLAPQLVQENPEVKEYTRIFRNPPTIVKNPQNPALIYEEVGFVFTDPSLFSIFTFPLKYGNAINLLQKPFTVIISEKVAAKYFGQNNAIGKSILYNGQNLLEIVAIAENVPSNSTITFDFVASLETFKKINQFAFDNLPNFETFLLINRRESIPRILRNIKVANKLIAALNFSESDTYELEPLHELRFGSSYTFNGKPGIKLLQILSGIALLILLLALFNYINLTTARSTLRAKEIGVRKTVGANRINLIKQFYLETIVVTFFAFLLSIVLFFLFRGLFNDLFGISVGYSNLANKVFITLLIILFGITTFLGGLYPALLLSGFSPIKALKGNYISRSQGTKARSILIIFQFGVSAILIISSLVMQRQIKYNNVQDLGFKREQVLSIKLSNSISLKSENFKRSIINRVGIPHPSLTDTPFFKNFSMSKFKIGTTHELMNFAVLQVDADFVQNLGLNWSIAPDKNAPTTDKGFYISLNEKAVRELGYTNENVIGQAIWYENSQEFGKVVGVVKNFNLSSPQLEVQPMLFLVKNAALPTEGFKNMQLRLHPQDNIANKLKILKKVYQEYDAESPFQYSFLDDDFQKTFLFQTRISYMIQVFTFVAILLACLGLFGLMAFIGQTRSKEVSVRKVMGASVLNIFILLSKDFFVLISISILVAIPSAYYVMQKWLNDFVYRIEIDWWIFASGGFTILAIAMLTIFYQVLKAALSNPIKALRSE